MFKTDYLPLERMAGGPQIERIKVNTLNPDAETKTVTESRTARDKARRDAEGARREATTKDLTPPPPQPPAKAGDKGTVADAERARADAAKKDKDKPKKTEPAPSAAGSGSTASMAPARGTGLEADGAARSPDVLFVPTPPESVAAVLALAAPRPARRWSTWVAATAASWSRPPGAMVAAASATTSTRSAFRTPAH